MNIKRVVRIALFTSIALIMHFVESMLPPLLAFAPGAKMGLANVVTLIAMMILGYRDAVIIMVARCLLASLYGGVTTLMYSLPAGAISLLVMIVLYQFLCPPLGIMGISFAGAVVFNMIQIIIASIIVGSITVVALLPVMLIASTIAGLFIGIAGYFTVKYLPISVYAN